MMTKKQQCLGYQETQDMTRAGWRCLPFDSLPLPSSSPSSDGCTSCKTFLIAISRSMMSRLFINAAEKLTDVWSCLDIINGRWSAVLLRKDAFPIAKVFLCTQDSFLQLFELVSFHTAMLSANRLNPRERMVIKWYYNELFMCIATVTNEIRHVAYMVHGRGKARGKILFVSNFRRHKMAIACAVTINTYMSSR